MSFFFFIGSHITFWPYYSNPFTFLSHSNLVTWIKCYKTLNIKFYGITFNITYSPSSSLFILNPIALDLFPTSSTWITFLILVLHKMKYSSKNKNILIYVFQKVKAFNLGMLFNIFFKILYCWMYKSGRVFFHFHFSMRAMLLLKMGEVFFLMQFNF